MEDKERTKEQLISELNKMRQLVDEIMVTETERERYERELANVIYNTSHLINTPLTIALGYMELVALGAKEMTPELASMIRHKLLEIRELVTEGLVKNVTQLKIETSDGLTPVKRMEREGENHEANNDC